MINFYQVWKDDKESEPKKKKRKGKHECIVCRKRFYDEGSLKMHMNSKHGLNSYSKFTAALQFLEEERRNKILELMK